MHTRIFYIYVTNKPQSPIVIHKLHKSQTQNISSYVFNLIEMHFHSKGQTHDEISQYSGASITTRGRFISPAEKSRATVHDRPLYLFIQGNSKASIDRKFYNIISIFGTVTILTEFALQWPRRKSPKSFRPICRRRGCQSL